MPPLRARAWARLSLSGCGLVLLGAALPASAQESPLAEAARREQQRREEARRKAGAGSPVITEEALAGAAAGRGTLSTPRTTDGGFSPTAKPDAPPATETSPTPRSASTAEPEADALAAREKRWRARFAAARARLKAAEESSTRISPPTWSTLAWSV